MAFPVPLNIGVEEEYQLIDPETRDLKAYVQQMIESDRVLEEQLKVEFLQSQIETGTRVCDTVKDVRVEMLRVRKELAALAGANGVKIAAAGTHPFAQWARQTITNKPRYFEFVEDMGHVVRSLLIFGMHVHIGFGEERADRELMILVMNQMRYFLPHMLALSGSSPFWMGEDTRLKSYRTVIFSQMPRTGIPQAFMSWSEYDAYITTLGKIGALGNGTAGGLARGDVSRIWWDLRPHQVYNTLEFRICDVMPRVDDAVAVIALYQALVAKLIRLKENNMRWQIYPRDFISENKWRAARYGVHGSLIDFGKEMEVPFSDLVEEFIDLVDDVVDELDSRQEIAHLREIVQRGTSADRQLATYYHALQEGATPREALCAVVDNLIEETVLNPIIQG